jgi:hypothetical protein
MKNKKNITEIIISIIGVFLFEYGLICFNRYILMSFPLIMRLLLMIVMYWLIALVPIIICIKNKYKLSSLGFNKNKISKQIIIGFVIATIMSLFLTLILVLIFGKENIHSSLNYKYIWQYAYQFIYFTIGVALTEEFIFRGYFLKNIKDISKNSIIPIIITSLLFGLFHIFNGNIIQVIMSSFIGLILALCKEKIKDCSLLSLVIAHGTYDWLMVLFAAIL